MKATKTSLIASLVLSAPMLLVGVASATSFVISEETTEATSAAKPLTHTVFTIESKGGA